METKQINIVQVYEENVLDIAQLKITDIRNMFIELWEKKPIITQFPDLIAIVEPTQQLNCVIQDRKVTITNQDIGKEFGSRDLENFIRFVEKFPKIMGKPLKAFGFNYSFFFSFPEEKAVEIKKRNTELISDPNGEKLIGGGINMAYMEGDARVQIISTPIYGEDLKDMIGLNIQTNVHFLKNSILPFSELISLFKKWHDKLGEKVNNIFNIQ